MPTTKWVRTSDLPESNCAFDKTGNLQKIQMREWALVPVIAKGMVKGEGVTSTDQHSVPGSDAPGPGVVLRFREGEAVAFVYAQSAGLANLQSFKNGNPTDRSGAVLAVEVLKRFAQSEAKLSLTTLMGKTFAINARDAIRYEMENTLTFSRSGDPTKIFADVPVGTDHVVVCSHGGVPEPSRPSDDNRRRLAMFIGGLNNQSVRLDVDNVEAAFSVLHGKVTEHAVIWLTGCLIGANSDFCSKAASASRCRVVAPGDVLLDNKIPRGKVDTLDKKVMPKVWQSDGTLWNLGDLCALQNYYKFKVPI